MHLFGIRVCVVSKNKVGGLRQVIWTAETAWRLVGRHRNIGLFLAYLIRALACGSSGVRFILLDMLTVMALISQVGVSTFVVVDGAPKRCAQQHIASRSSIIWPKER